MAWPHLDAPCPGGAGLGWRIGEDYYEYTLLNVRLPRLDAHRKANYLTSTARYNATGRQFNSVREDGETESVDFVAEGEKLLGLKGGFLWGSLLRLA